MTALAYAAGQLAPLAALWALWAGGCWAANHYTTTPEGGDHA